MSRLELSRQPVIVRCVDNALKRVDLLDGTLAPAALARALLAAQRLVDSYLHKDAVFPPAAIRELFAVDHRYPGWAEDSVGIHLP